MITPVRTPAFLEMILAMALAGCGVPNPTEPDAFWMQVREETSCEALNPNYCMGLYGFTVMNDGRYTVGPADNGNEIRGILVDSERAALFRNAALVAGGVTGSADCDQVATIPGVRDVVDVTGRQNIISRVYDLSFQGTCYRGGRDAATRLHAGLSALMAKYYPRPFP